MSALRVTLSDLVRDPMEVATNLFAWARGDRADAITMTLAAAAPTLHARVPTLWVWRGSDAGGSDTWVLPVTLDDAFEFSAPGPSGLIVDALAAAIDTGAEPGMLGIGGWHGWTALTVPGADPEIGALALTERYPESRVHLAGIPAGVLGRVTVLDLDRRRAAPSGHGLRGLATELNAHPLRVALTLAAHRQPLTGPGVGPGLAPHLRELGRFEDAEAEPTPAPPQTTIDADPCPSRRHARRVLQRLLRTGKVGPGHHTEFDHLYRGAPADQRHVALQVGEALLRAGLLGEKRNVGQRHVFVNRAALPEVHALIERGESHHPALEAVWTAPMPGDS